MNEFKPLCDDFIINCGNSDALCFRISKNYSRKLIIDKPETCNNCPYNRNSYGIYSPTASN